MQCFIRLFTSLTITLVLVACGGGGGGSSQPAGNGALAGDPASLALAATVNVAAQPAAAADIVNGAILTRLDVVIAADATVGQVNAALGSIGASIVAMRAGSASMTVAVPRAADAAALQALADTLQTAPGIVAALPGPAPLFAVAPPGPAASSANLSYLQNARFPAAWNARRAAGNCDNDNDKVTVIVADAFHRPADIVYNNLSTQLSAVQALGSGTVVSDDPTAGFHGYDVLTTLAARLDATVPTGANPFPDCLILKAVQVAGLNPYSIIAHIEAALATSSGKVVVNASFGWDACGTPNAAGVYPACTPANLNAPKAHFRAIWAAMQRASLASFADRALVVSSAGNEADKPVGAAYLGAALAPLGSAFNVAATADSTMSFATDTTKWEPSPVCTTPPCLPSLTATPLQAIMVERVLFTLGAAATTPAANVLIVGSVDNFFLERSTSSDFGASVLAVGEGVPTLLGGFVNGTSFSAPQVAGLASYLWLLSPELRNRPARDTVAAIKANMSNGLVIDGVAIADGLINAYATVLSLDETVALTPSSAKIRLALLDVAGQIDAGGNVIGDGKFDLADLQAYRAFYLDASGAPIEPTTPTYSRFDLNGDGFTGGSRTTRMDLDPRGSTRFGKPQLSVLSGQIGGVAVTYNEQAITDTRALCFFATTALYTGTDLAARDALLAELCGAVGSTLELRGASGRMGFCSFQSLRAEMPGVSNPGIAFSTTGGGTFGTPFVAGDGVNIDFLSGQVEGSFLITATSGSAQATDPITVDGAIGRWDHIGTTIQALEFRPNNCSTCGPGDYLADFSASLYSCSGGSSAPSCTKLTGSGPDAFAGTRSGNTFTLALSGGGSVSVTRRCQF